MSPLNPRAAPLIAWERRGGAVDLGPGESDAVVVKEHASAVRLVVVALKVVSHRNGDLHTATEGGELC